jgi:hypothetical protein
VTKTIQVLLRDRPPEMILDMGLGSREQGFPSHKPAIPLPPLPARPL